MQYKKAVEIIGLSKLRVKALSIMLWPVVLGLGIFGWIKWKWYAFPLVVLIFWVLGNLYALYMTKRLKKITGLDLHEQVAAYHESLAGQGHPLAKNYNEYREYVKSIPDEEA